MARRVFKYLAPACAHSSNQQPPRAPSWCLSTPMVKFHGFLFRLGKSPLIAYFVPAAPTTAEARKTRNRLYRVGCPSNAPRPAASVLDPAAVCLHRTRLLAGAPAFRSSASTRSIMSGSSSTCSGMATTPLQFACNRSPGRTTSPPTSTGIARLPHVNSRATPPHALSTPSSPSRGALEIAPAVRDDGHAAPSVCTCVPTISPQCDDHPFRWQ